MRLRTVNAQRLVAIEAFAHEPSRRTIQRRQREVMLREGLLVPVDPVHWKFRRVFALGHPYVLMCAMTTVRED